MGGDGLGTNTRGLVHSSPLIAAPGCLHAGKAKMPRMLRGVGSQSVKRSSCDLERSMPNFAQLLGVRARTQAQECVTPKLPRCHVIASPLEGHMALCATPLSFTFFICETRIVLPPS